MKITTNNKVKLIEGLNPSDQCMLSALYSRSIKGIENDISQLDRAGGSESFMKQHLIGFGDKSVGDNGYVMLCFENVSMLAAKVIQDNPLYSGTEVSSRYIDLSHRDLYHTSENENVVQQKWMGIYRDVLSHLTSEFLVRFPMAKGDDPKTYHKAINAKAFDIARGFIPMGMTTNLSWVTNIRQARDHLLRMAMHPLKEIRDIAADTSKLLTKAYPDVFTPITITEDQRYYMLECSQLNERYDPKSEDVTLLDYVHNDYNDLPPRPRGTELPRHLGNNHIKFQVNMDFGGWRDLQRHRALNITFPEIRNDSKFNAWYISELKKYGCDVDLTEVIELTANETSPYCAPLGYCVSSVFSGSLSAFTYMIELRSGFGVHPTVRDIVYSMADKIKEQDNNVMFHQPSYDLPEFNYKRGKDDITKVVK